MKILVTGGAGFIGSHVVDAFLKEGHSVVVLDNFSTGKKINLPDKVMLYETDYVGADLDPIFKKEKFDVVCHHAAQIDVRFSYKNPVEDVRINVLGGVRLLDACEKYGIKKFLFASTGGAIYGEQEAFPATEDHPIRPCSPYGLDKFLFENYLHYYHRKGTFETVSLRYANVYGPRQNPHGEAGVVAIFIDKLLNNETPIINGDGRQKRDFIYVKDIASANVAALKLTGDHVLNLGTELETDIVQLYDLIEKNMNTGIKASFGPAKEGEQLRSVITFQKAKEVLGWQPTVSLENGIAETVSWFAQNYEKI